MVNDALVSKLHALHATASDVSVLNVQCSETSEEIPAFGIKNASHKLGS